MPIFVFIQTIASRIIIGIIALLAALGLGVVSSSPSDLSIQKDVPQEIQEIVTPAQEVPIYPQDTPVVPEKDTKIVPEKEEKVLVPKKEPDDQLGRKAELSEDVISPADEIEIESPLSFSQINTETTGTLVNILCTQKVVGAATPITGSGVIIDPRGAVITNAHVAQFFLLKDYPVEDALECILRTGSPARHTYTAELLHISPEWVRIHANDITNSEAKGTGEHDYAFLRITGRTDPDAALPTTFPFVPIDINSHAIETGDFVLAAAYPAGFLGGISIQRDLYSVSSVATVGERFTFFENTIDLFSIGGTVVSQGGSSGGAVVSDKNKLIGVIVTSTQADTTSERDLRAITLGHIDRALTEHIQTTVEGLLFGNLELKAKLFNLGTAPRLTNMLLEHLIK